MFDARILGNRHKKEDASDRGWRSSEIRSLKPTFSPVFYPLFLTVVFWLLRVTVPSVLVDELFVYLQRSSPSATLENALVCSHRFILITWPESHHVTWLSPRDLTFVAWPDSCHVNWLLSRDLTLVTRLHLPSFCFPTISIFHLCFVTMLPPKVQILQRL